MTHGKALKKPIPIEWYLWDGRDETKHFINEWAKPDGIDNRVWFCRLYPDQAHQLYDDESYTAEVYDSLHSRWIPLRTGAYVMKGVEGECYPCDEVVFGKTYDITERHDG